MIFDDRARTDGAPKRYRESDFAFLNRSAWPEAERVRAFLELVAADYPEGELTELVRRLRSGDSANYRSASFELLLHGILRAMGCLLELHPVLTNGSTRRPDFLVTAPCGEQFYLEAVLAAENNQVDRAGSAFAQAAIDILAQARHPRFMVSIRTSGAPATPPRGALLRDRTIAWLDTLDFDQVLAEFRSGGVDCVPRMEWAHDGWDVELEAIPLADTRTLLGVLNTGAGWVDATGPLGNALLFKARRYGELGRPYVIAVNFDAFSLSSIDEMQALFGREVVVVSTEGDAEPELRRAPGGLWLDASGAPRYTRVSAVWFFNDINPFDVARRRSRVYVNPWAVHGVPDALLILPVSLPNNEAGTMEPREGVALNDLLGLNESWPE